MNTPTVDFHHLDVCHAWRTKKPFDKAFISFINGLTMLHQS
ncbi:hypothetical protein EUBDOL_00621 [Amedibacillus dolichus DSM 3991]|uniref:Uncharacterized protein n=1 Tax=Amedibacillus dolichus DSM 3991 TaxID=428127 RepID=A8R9V4_9FIRM|nr:hypothetical protein EUBDOL_00621 [Amedibacillus dolichus DSM 3991]